MCHPRPPCRHFVTFRHLSCNFVVPLSLSSCNFVVPLSWSPQVTTKNTQKVRTTPKILKNRPSRLDAPPASRHPVFLFSCFPDSPVTPSPRHPSSPFSNFSPVTQSSPCAHPRLPSLTFVTFRCLRVIFVVPTAPVIHPAPILTFPLSPAAPHPATHGSPI